MRIMILSVTAGHGHNATANALAEELRARQIDVVVEDLYQYLSRLRFRVVDKGYLLSTKYFPRQFGTTYSTLERYAQMRHFIATLNINNSMQRKFASYFKGYTPDVIITTHVFGAQILHELKRQNLLQIPVIGICTDYCIHPFWEEVDSVEYIVTASELLHYSALKKGLAADRLLPFGLPVMRAFLQRHDKAEVRTQLGLSPDKKTVLVMGGSMGHGDMAETVSEIDRLDMSLQIICICGRNEKLYNKMRLLETKSDLHVRGFVENVPQYMDAADCIVTKPGGLTVSEAMAKKLPMVIVNPIPGPELRNTDFLVGNGIAVKVGKFLPVDEAVHYLLSNPNRLRLMEEMLTAVSRPDATEKICDFAVDLAKKGSPQ